MARLEGRHARCTFCVPRWCEMRHGAAGGRDHLPHDSLRGWISIALTLATATYYIAPLHSQTVFRATTESVAISTTVKRGNNSVANLTAKDFLLTDNGVAQTVEAVTIESVPLD